METIKERAKQAEKEWLLSDDVTRYGYAQGYIQGATDQAEIFEQNRLAHCERMNKEEAEREMEFCTAFIKEHQRTPTFSDAIEITRKEVIEECCEALYGLANDLGCDLLDIEVAKEYMRDKLTK